MGSPQAHSADLISHEMPCATGTATGTAVTAKKGTIKSSRAKPATSLSHVGFPSGGGPGDLHGIQPAQVPLLPVPHVLPMRSTLPAPLALLVAPLLPPPPPPAMVVEYNQVKPSKAHKGLKHAKIWQGWGTLATCPNPTRQIRMEQLACL